MGKLPVEGGSKGVGGQQGSRSGTRLGSRAFSARGIQGLGSAAASLSTADEKTRRISRQHLSKGPHSATVVTPSLDEGKEKMHAVKSLFKPYRVSISVRVFFVRVHVPRGVWVVLYSLQHTTSLCSTCTDKGFSLVYACCPYACDKFLSITC